MSSPARQSTTKAAQPHGVVVVAAGVHHGDDLLDHRVLPRTMIDLPILAPTNA